MTNIPIRSILINENSILVKKGDKMEKKEQVITVARDLFHKHGFKKVSMDEIAKYSGVTKKTIYSYFKSKEELLKYFIDEELQRMKKIIDEEEAKGQDFFETANNAICKLLKYRKERDFLSVIAEEAEWLKNPTVVENLKLIDNQIEEYIKTKLEKAKNNGDIYYEDLDITAFLVYKMYIALMIEWNDKSKNIDEQMIAKIISNILKNGLRKDVK